MEGSLQSLYTGYIRNEDGLKHGPAIIITLDYRYEGEMKNDMKEGRGCLYHSDGDVFMGEWKNGNINGYGIITHFNGASYEGDWLDN